MVWMTKTCSPHAKMFSQTLQPLQNRSDNTWYKSWKQLLYQVKGKIEILYIIMQRSKYKAMNKAQQIAVLTENTQHKIEKQGYIYWQVQIETPGHGRGQEQHTGEQVNKGAGLGD